MGYTGFYRGLFRDVWGAGFRVLRSERRNDKASEKD